MTASSICGASIASENSRLSIAMTWSGPNCAVKRPFALRQLGWAFARDRIDVRIERWACSPISRLLLSRARKTDFAANIRPIAIEPAPSSSGRPRTIAAKVAAAAIRMPRRATESSNSVMNEGGSLLSLNALKKPRSPFARRNCLRAYNQELPSKRNAKANTT
jgi:hypothetical protein